MTAKSNLLKSLSTNRKPLSGEREWVFPGVVWSTLDKFDAAHVAATPDKQPGIYLICDAGGPIYAGRSSKSVKRRMLAHLNGYGNENIKIATKIKEIAQNLTFTYFDVPASSVAEVEIFLIEALGVTRLANMRREARFEEDDPLNIGE